MPTLHEVHVESGRARVLFHTDGSLTDRGWTAIWVGERQGCMQPESPLFEADATGLYLRAGTKLDFETKPTLSVTVEVADASIAGSTPVSQSFSLLVGDSNEAPTGVAVANRTITSAL